MERKALVKDRQYLPEFTHTRCRLLCGECCAEPLWIRWNLPWPGCAIHQGVNGVCSQLAPDPAPRGQKAPFKQQRFPLLRALLHLPNIFEHFVFCAVPLWCFPGAPIEDVFHQYLVGMESSTPPLINSLQMLQSHVCFTLPSVPFPCHIMALAALTEAPFE